MIHTEEELALTDGRREERKKKIRDFPVGDNGTSNYILRGKFNNSRALEHQCIPTRTGGIPQKQVDRLAVDHHVRRVIVKHGRDVLAGEGVRRVRDEQAGLSDRAVADNHALDVLQRRNQS